MKIWKGIKSKAETCTFHNEATNKILWQLKWEEIIAGWGYLGGLQGGVGIWDGDVLGRLRMAMKIPGNRRGRNKVQGHSGMEAEE